MSSLFLIITMQRYSLLAAGIALFLVFECSSLPADEVTNHAAENQLAYRRIFVPADQPESWPVGSDRYLPLKSAEFARRQQQAIDSRALPPSAHLRLQEVVLRAQLSDSLKDDWQITGIAEMKITADRDQPRILALEPLNLAVTSARWDEEGSAPARLGLWRTNEESINSKSAIPILGVFVEGSGHLVFDWETTGVSNDGQNVEFDIQTPPAIRKQLELTLPANANLKVTPGTVIQNDLHGLNQRIWQIELGSTTHHRIQIHDPRGPFFNPNHQPEIMLRTQVATEYRVTPEGLDLEAVIQLEEHAPEAMRLQLQMVGPGQTVSATVDGENVDWNVLEAEDSRYLQLPLKSGAHRVKIHALAPILLDQPWTLPKIIPRELLWTQGTVHLQVDSRLQLQSLSPVECTLQQSDRDNHSFVPGAEYSLQESSQQASLKLVVGKRPHRLQIRTATIASRQDNSSIGQAIAIVRSNDDSHFYVEAEIHPSWEILSVETEPASELAEWRVYQDGQRQVVRVQLARALQSDVPVRIVFDGRVTTDLQGQPSTANSLRMLRFRNATIERQLLLIKSNESQQLVPDSDTLKALIDADSVSSEDAELLPEDWQGVLLDLGQIPVQSAIELKPQQATFTCDAHVELNVLPDVNEHRIRLICTPTSGAVSEISVHFSQPILDTLTWSFLGADDSASAEADIKRVLSTSDKSGSIHRLILPLATNKPFQLAAGYKVSRNALELNHPIEPLVVSLPEAATTHAWVLFRSSESNVTIDPHGCTPVAWPELASESSTHILGCYRLNSAFSKSERNVPAIVWKKTPLGQNAEQLFAKFAECSTVLSVNGTAMNEVVYTLENHGAKRAEIKLPANTVLQSAWVGTLPFTPSQVVNENSAITLSLNPQESDSSLTLRYISEQQPLGSTTLVHLAYPKTSFPVMQGRWTLWNSRQYAVAGAPSESVGHQKRWRQRLFGSLARPDQTAVFSPFRSQDWLQLRSDVVAQPYPAKRTEPLAAEEESKSSESKVSRALFMPGWHEYSVRFVDQPAPVEVIRTDSVKAWTLALWLVATVVGLWQLTGRPRWLIVSLIVAAAACFIADPTPSAMPQAIMLGLVSAVIVRSIWGGSDSGSSNRAVRSATSALASLLAANLLTACCYASPADAKSDFMDGAPAQLTSAIEKIPRVLIPIDEDGQPVGDEVYLSEQLYDKLDALAQVDQTAAKWVVTATDYQGSLIRGFSKLDSQQRQFDCGDWMLLFDVTSMRPNCDLILPLARNEAQWLDGQHRLDGVPVDIQWLPDNRSCQIRLTQMGAHRLEIALRPHVSRRPRTTSIRLSIPTVADSRLELQAPEELTGLEVFGATRLRRRGKEDSFLAVLPPQDRLELRWTPAHRTIDMGSDWIAELVSWLHIERSGAQVEVRIRIKSGTGAMPRLQLETDPHLELLPIDADSPISDLETVPGNPRLIQVELRPEIRTPVEIPLRFRLDRSTSIGKIAFPQVRLANVATVRRSMAVTVAAGLSYQEQGGDGMEVLSPTQFASTWGSDNGEPLFAYTLTSKRPAWSLLVRPDPQSFTAKQSVQLRCGMEQTEVKYYAQIDDTAGEFFMHRLHVPDDMQIESVAVQDQNEGKARAVRWALSRDHQLTVFLTKPIRGPHALTIEGSLAHSPDQSIEVPDIALQRADSSPTQLEIYRAPNVLVDWNWPGMERQPLEMPIASTINLEVPVGRFNLLQNSRQPLKLDISTNDSRFSADCLSTLEELDDEWSATLWIHIRARQGVVSRFHVAAPQAWIDPSMIESAGKIQRLKRSSMQNRYAYEVLLAEPLSAGEDAILQIMSPLALDADQRITMPDLRVFDSKEVTQYVALPRVAHGQSIEWILRGLQQASLPKDLDQAAKLAAESSTYVITQSGYSARRRVFSPSIRRPELRIAEMRGVVDSAGNWSGTAELILQPGRASECQLILPPDSQMLYLSVGGKTVPPQPTRNDRWKISLGPPLMPRMITVSYTTKVNLQDSTAVLSAPTIMIDQRTLSASAARWQIQPVGHVSLGDVIAGQKISNYHFVRSAYEDRLEALAEASSSALRLPRWEAEQWFLPWHRRLFRAKAKLQNVEGMLVGNNAVDRENLPANGHGQEATALDSSLTAWQTLIDVFAPMILSENGTTELVQEPVDSQTTAPLQPRPRLSIAGDNVSLYYIGNENGRLQIHMNPAQEANWRQFLGISVILAIAAGAIYFTLRYPGWYQVLMDRPHLTTLIVGFVWWTCLSPSALGLAIIIVALVSLVRRVLSAIGQSTATLTIDEQSNQHVLG